MKKVIKAFSISLVCLMLTAAVGCSKKMESGSSKADSKTSENVAMPQMAEGGMVKTEDKSNTTKGVETTFTSVSDRKVIKRTKLDMETKKFNAAVNFVIERTEKEKGYIESSNIYGGKSSDGNYVNNKTASFVIRIPKDKMSTFLKDAEALGVIVNRSDNDEDVTSQYFDTEARVKSLKIQEERLLAILQKSEKLTDVIELERRLSEIRTEIEGLTGTLKRYDNLVALATVEISIREVQTESPLVPKPIGFGEKLADSFKNSVTSLYDILKDFVIVIVTLVPFLLLGAVLFVPARLIVKKVNKNRKEIKIKEDNK